MRRRQMPRGRSRHARSAAPVRPMAPIRPGPRHRIKAAARRNLLYCRVTIVAAHDRREGCMGAEAETAEVFDAFQARGAAIADACTRCGDCFRACPMIGPAGIAEADPAATAGAIVDLITGGAGTAEAASWTEACSGSGYCIPACHEGINPRFMVQLARGFARRNAGTSPLGTRWRQPFQTMSRGVRVLSRLQLPPETLARFAPPREPRAAPPDVVFYTGCNVLKTPHIALLCLDIMDRLGTDYQVMGGPTHCCGTTQLRQGDIDTLGRFANNTINKLAQSKSKTVLAWCPSCMMQFGETVLPTYEKAIGEKPFDFLPFMPHLRAHLDELRPFLKHRVDMKVALHKHPGIAGVMEAAEALLRAVPGVEIVTLDVPAVGLQSVNL